MSPAVLTGLTLAGAAIGSLLALLGLWGSWSAWLKHRNPIDIALSVAALMWLTHLLVTTAVEFAGSNQQSAYATDVGFQVLMISVSFFLVTSAGLAGKGINLVLGLQAVLGGVALNWAYWGSSGQVLAHQMWIGFNLFAALLLVAAVARQVYLTRSFRGWLALAGGIFGIGISVDDLMLIGDANRMAALLHHFYAGFLLVMWHLVTYRAETAKPSFAESRDFDRLTGFAPDPDPDHSHDQEIAASAVAGERRRIAQDLHDGVASQIVSILSSLDSRAPQHQAVALALENCLVDMKMTVDAIDSANDSVLEALGRLRHRVQHSLDKLGIHMEWKVEISDQLEAVRGEKAQQALRIAQESLANVMRHAQASAVEVVCRFVPSADSMVLEIRDNGLGIARNQDGRPSGKGLSGMRRRAKSVGGELLINSKVGVGTRVRFTVPLTSDHSLSA